MPYFSYLKLLNICRLVLYVDNAINGLRDGSIYHNLCPSPFFPPKKT